MSTCWSAHPSCWHNLIQPILGSVGTPVGQPGFCLKLGCMKPRIQPRMGCRVLSYLDISWLTSYLIDAFSTRSFITASCARAWPAPCRHRVSSGGARSASSKRGATPSCHHKIRVFSEPTLGKSWRRRQTTYQKKVLGNPTHGTNHVRENLAVRTGCRG